MDCCRGALDSAFTGNKRASQRRIRVRRGDVLGGLRPLVLILLPKAQFSCAGGQRRRPIPRRHTPRKRGIQYAAASQPTITASGILDRPPARTMTAVGGANSLRVIASEAKQSRVTHAALDCFAPLAMTPVFDARAGRPSGLDRLFQSHPHTPLRSRGTIVPRLIISTAPRQSRVQGRPGVCRHPRPPCGKKCTGQEPQDRPGHPGLPCATALRLTSCSPWGPGFLAPIIRTAASRNGTNLTSASGGQDHTTSPSARHRSSTGASRPSLPALHVS